MRWISRSGWRGRGRAARAPCAAPTPRPPPPRPSAGRPRRGPRRGRAVLPQVHHLVQQGVGRLVPAVPVDVAAAHGDLVRLAGLVPDAQLSEPGAHPPGDPERQRGKRAAEMARVQFREQPGQALRLLEVAGLRPVAGALVAPGRGGVLLGLERKDLVFGGAPQRPRGARRHEPHHRLQDPVRRHRVAAVDAEHALGREAHHDAAVVRHANAADRVQAEQLEPARQERLLGQTEPRRRRRLALRAALGRPQPARQQPIEQSHAPRGP